MKAIVVGATSGIGYEVAILLASRGWEVGIAGRREDLLQKIKNECKNIIVTERIDVTCEDAPYHLNCLIEKLGGMDLYFHSSGIGYQNPNLDMEKELNTVQTNSLGFTRMVDTVFKYFENHPEQTGHIAVISSIAGTKGLGAAPAYSATKRYVNTYLECLCQLCTIRSIKNIKIHDIRPGFVKTPLLSDGGKYPLQLNAKKVANDIIKGIERNKAIITIDWKYRIIVFFWRLIPRWIWVRMKIVSKL